MKVVAGIDSMFYHFWYLELLLLTSCLFFLSQRYAQWTNDARIPMNKDFLPTNSSNNIY